jgi:hypothetical protein
MLKTANNEVNSKKKLEPIFLTYGLVDTVSMDSYVGLVDTVSMDSYVGLVDTVSMDSRVPCS